MINPITGTCDPVPEDTRRALTRAIANAQTLHVPDAQLVGILERALTLGAESPQERAQHAATMINRQALTRTVSTAVPHGRV